MRKPNFERLKKVLFLQGEPDRVPFMELFCDIEVIEALTGEPLRKLDLREKEHKERYLRGIIKFYYNMGYDYVRASSNLGFGRTNILTTQDTAVLSRGQRSWVDEHHGVIESWSDFERYPWPKIEEINYWDMEFISENLPAGMKIIAATPGGILENLTWLMSYEVLCYKLYEDEKLVEAIADRIGNLMCADFEALSDFESMGALIISDDLGFKTQTMVPPDTLRKYIFPWYKKLSHIAHQHGLPVILHSCGNLKEVMEDLIADVKIDAKHSYEDVIMSPIEAKKRYGDRIAILGGVDVNVLAGKSEREVREYVRKIIKECAPGGGYALGSGNSIANYIPVANYVAMLQEGLKYGSYPI